MGKARSKSSGSDSDYSYYSEYTYSSESRSPTPKRKKRKRGRSRHSRKRRERRKRSRKKSRSRRRGGRGNARGRSRSREKRADPPKTLQNLGNHGSGDHEKDLEEFIRANELGENAVQELRGCDESIQKKVMGTDGGVHIFQLLGKVRSPDAIVFSRIRKESSKRR
eukprot:gnl/TRDRNA2_/TRDRNA2_68786_c0_seq1.p1 gnl/TRDRNA2_/TRDRNA2_68786_c0~~gnl/TRDRNA2_/TRDRNA2_68786_c0_seq1.p1  ORF type:complete len:166 (-),score=11.83 gnl/TRDRNA2_/TRDRNA2_68786_c0_seq1:347-844(-)